MSRTQVVAGNKKTPMHHKFTLKKLKLSHWFQISEKKTINIPKFSLQGLQKQKIQINLYNFT